MRTVPITGPMLTLISLFLVAGDHHVLFIGNSHTGSNDLTGMVKRLAESDGSGRRVITVVEGSSFLEDAWLSTQIQNRIRSRKWDTIIMQGLKLSSSHQYQYDHTNAVKLGKLARENSAKSYYFAEWPRADWDEAEWIVGEYESTSKSTRVPIIPLGLAWPGVLKEFPELRLWQTDGNHASANGSFLAACGLYYGVFGGDAKPGWKPPTMLGRVADRLKAHARRAVQ